MKTIKICKAQGFRDKPVESTTIQFDQEAPRFDSLERQGKLYDVEAQHLADVLCTTLPGGTLDRLMAELLQRRASLLIVPMFEPKKED
jgi:hypothetical protein